MPRVRHLLSLVATLTLAAACSDTPRSPTAATGQVAVPDALLKAYDANLGGPSGFYFLPPVGHYRSSYPGDFDATAAPVVEICARKIGACVGAPLVSFSMHASDPTRGIVRRTEREEYLLWWRTDFKGFENVRDFRIRVLLDGMEVGYSDIVLVRTLWDLLRTNWREYHPVFDRAIFPIRFRIEQQRAYSVIANGGDTARVVLPGGTEVVAPLPSDGPRLRMSAILRDPAAAAPPRLALTAAVEVRFEPLDAATLSDSMVTVSLRMPATRDRAATTSRIGFRTTTWMAATPDSVSWIDPGVDTLNLANDPLGQSTGATAAFIAPLVVPLQPSIRLMPATTRAEIVAVEMPTDCRTSASLLGRDGRAFTASEPGGTTVLFVHGVDLQESDCADYTGGENGSDYFDDLIERLEPTEALSAASHVVFADFPTFAGVAAPADALHRALRSLRESGASSGAFARTVIVAHSMGGLVTRDLLRRLDADPIPGVHIERVVTLGSPHEGTPLGAFGANRDNLDDPLIKECHEQRSSGSYDGLANLLRARLAWNTVTLADFEPGSALLATLSRAEARIVPFGGSRAPEAGSLSGFARQGLVAIGCALEQAGAEPVSDHDGISSFSGSQRFPGSPSSARAKEYALDHFGMVGEAGGGQLETEIDQLVSDVAEEIRGALLPAQLAIASAIGPVTATRPFGLAIEVRQANGQVVPGGQRRVTLTLLEGPAGAVLAGTTTSLTVNGVARFENLSVDRPGEGYVIVARSDGLAEAVTTPFSATPPATAAGLLGDYRLAGDFRNSLRGGLDGSVFGAQPAPDRFGAAGGALRFDGLDDYATLPAILTNNLTSGTISLWIRLDDQATQFNVFAKTVSSTSFPFRAQFAGPSVNSADRIYFSVNGEGTAANAAAPLAQRDLTEWHQYTFTWSPSGKAIYLDGSLIGSFAGTGSSPGTGDLVLSPQSSARNERLRGSLDDLGIWNRALSSAEVMGLYEPPPSDDPMTLLYADDFSGGLGNWVRRGGGSWTTNAEEELVGDYGISCGSSSCPQAQLILADHLQPGEGNWRMEVRTGFVQAYCCFNGGAYANVAKFSLWVSDSFKEAIDAGNSWVGGTVPTRTTSAYASHQSFPWTSLAYRPQTVAEWDPLAWQTAAIEKRGNVYTVFFNGQELYRVTRDFASPPKVGFNTYGGVRMDDFKLFRLP